MTLIAAWKTPSTCPKAVAALAESSREEVKAVERFMILVCFTEVLNSIVIVFSEIDAIHVIWVYLMYFVFVVLEISNEGGADTCGENSFW